jgi:hypothetical protein
MSVSIPAVRIDEDIDIQKFHGWSMVSSSADEEFKSTPGSVPEPRKVFSGLNRSGPGCLRRVAKAIRNASSTTSPNDFPVACDTCRARCNNPSSIVIVVLIHQCIKFKHHDVKLGKTPENRRDCRLTHINAIRHGKAVCRPVDKPSVCGEGNRQTNN